MGKRLLIMKFISSRYNWKKEELFASVFIETSSFYAYTRKSCTLRLVLFTELLFHSVLVALRIQASLGIISDALFSKFSL